MRKPYTFGQRLFIVAFFLILFGVIAHDIFKDMKWCEAGTHWKRISDDRFICVPD